MESAHGFVEHWEEPLLGKQVSDLYLVKDRRDDADELQRLPSHTGNQGADFINQASSWSGENCRACAQSTAVAGLARLRRR
jgi:hypothetical protein